ncbi:phosphohistidine phosphatase [Pedococcus cremeus]|uniref:Phosphohistidine phosphatase n=1 Tax=Pedococcus cremeus TaxID=587636 RepID=A0A1H9RAM4_9MICO|nr:histidine phosphatase family protein [Pedococcus cremeus]SER69754.1 phosphohistidine phosphatase [Pedococcus cremeus]
MTFAGDDKVLILFRHAKAEQAPGKPDRDRELTHRGRRDAAAAGQWLRDNGFGPELVLCSPAVRTRQTWEAAADGGACGEQVDYDGRLYSGGASGALQVVRESGGEAQVVLVVGHNPTMATLASGLTEGDGSTAAHECLAAGFPTSAVAVIGYAGPWHDLALGSASLLRCHVSRG